MSFIKFKFEKDKEEKPLKKIEVGKGGKKKIKEEAKPKVDKLVKKKEGEKKKTFILEWDSELGYSGNPFKDEILIPVSNHIAGYEKERDRINLFIINNEQFGIISGESGIGKTILLRWLYEQLQQYKGKVLVYYLNGKVFSQEFVLLKSLVNPLLNLYEKKVKKLNKDVDMERNLSLLKGKLGSKKLVLLIDDVVIIPKQVMLLLKKMYSIMPLQIIVACNNQAAQQLRADEGLKDRLKIQLKGLDVQEARSMIKKRIKSFGGEDIFPFDDNHIKKICKIASYNPKQILYLCQHYAIELAVKQVKRKLPKESQVVKEEVKEEKEEVKEDEGSSEVPVLKEIPRTKEYQIRVIHQGAEAISLDDLNKDDKGNYKVKTVKKK